MWETKVKIKINKRGGVVFKFGMESIFKFYGTEYTPELSIQGVPSPVYLTAIPMEPSPPLRTW